MKKSIQIQGFLFINVSRKILIVFGLICPIFQNDAQTLPNTFAQLDLDHMLKGILNGKTQEQEENRALLEDEAEQGIAESQADLANALYKEGKIVEAKKWFILAANQGEVHSQTNLGILLEEEGNIPEAKEWYLKAIKQGSSQAQNNLGLLLEKEGKTDEAIKLFRKSAEQDNVYGQYNLGRCFEKKGKDALAKAWFRKAAQQDHLEAKQKLRLFGLF